MDQDLISPANVPSANAPAMPPIVPETTQATTTSTFAPWRTSRRTTGKFSSVFHRDLLERGKSIDGVLIRRPCVVSFILYHRSRGAPPEVEGLRTELIALPIRLSNSFDDKIDGTKTNYLFDQL